MTLTKFLAFGLIAASGFAATAPAYAVTSLASFEAIGTDRNIRWVLANASSGGGGVFYTTSAPTDNVAGAKSVSFSFLLPALAPSATGVTASFLMNGTVTETAATLDGTTLDQTGISGSFFFNSTTVIDGKNAGAKLLAGNFTATLSGARNGTTATMSSVTASFTSDFIDLTGATDADFLLDLIDFSPAFNASPTSGTPNRPVRSFRALADSGTFSYVPGAAPPPPVVVPEPESWALMIAGFGLVGAAARRHQRKTAFAG